MTKNSKKEKRTILEEVPVQILEEVAVQKLFKEISENEVLTDAEFKSLTEGYECLKQLVVPNMYSEVAMTLITVIYSRRNTNKGEPVTTDKVINDALNDTVVGKAILNEVICNEEDLWYAALLNDTYEDKFNDCADPVRLEELYIRK